MPAVLLAIPQKQPGQQARDMGGPGDKPRLARGPKDGNKKRGRPKPPPWVETKKGGRPKPPPLLSSGVLVRRPLERLGHRRSTVALKNQGEIVEEQSPHYVGILH